MLGARGLTPRTMERIVESADVVIVGGGIVGSAVAYFLSSDGAFQGRRIVAHRARPELRPSEHGALGRRAAPAVLDTREHRHVAVHAVADPPARDRVRSRCRCRLSRAGLPDHGRAEAVARCWQRTSRSSSPTAPTSCCWRPRSWRAASPGWRRKASPPAASAGRARAGSIPRAWHRCCAMRPRRGASRCCMTG